MNKLSDDRLEKLIRSAVELLREYEVRFKMPKFHSSYTTMLLLGMIFYPMYYTMFNPSLGGVCFMQEDGFMCPLDEPTAELVRRMLALVDKAYNQK